MKLEVKKSTLSGAIAVPGSKSHTIRGIAAALMADGVSTLHAPLDSADTRSALKAAERLGAGVETAADRWTIRGTGGRLVQPDSTLDLGNSGTGLRMLSALAATANFEVGFDGDHSLRTRLMGKLLDSLTQLGASTASSADGKCPLRVRGPLAGGFARVDGTTSQFLTSLLFAAPFAAKDCEFKLTFLNEKPYVGITLRWLDRLGIRYEKSDDLLCFKIPAPQRFRAFEAVIPADFSTAAFPLAAAALTGNGVAIRNLDFTDCQGDKAVVDYFAAMGATYRRNGDLSVEPGAALTGGDFDLNATPDALPVMAAAAAALPGKTTRLLNVPQARFKETDRISCMTAELRKMGAKITELDDGMVIEGANLRGAEVAGYGDHRIVMALAVAGLTASGTTVIDGAEAAAVTYPDFVADFRALGADFTLV